MGDMQKVLIVSTQDGAPPSRDRRQIMQLLADTLKSDAIRADTTLLEDLVFTVNNNRPAIYDKTNRNDPSEYDLVYLKNWQAQRDTAPALYSYLKSRGVKVISSELEDAPSINKVADSFTFALNGIPYPDTLYVTHADDLADAIAGSHIRYPAILKSIKGMTGKENFLVHSAAELNQKIA